jgi:hypothetical protein
MGPDDLLCSRTARPQKALVGRAQWKITQAPCFEENERVRREHLSRWMHGETDPGHRKVRLVRWRRAVTSEVEFSPTVRNLDAPISRA